MSTVLLAVVGLTGCSAAPPPAPTATGGMAPNIARLVIDGQNAITGEQACSQNGWTWTIEVGDQTSGATAVIDTSDAAVTAKSLRLHHVDGFSGSYWEGHNGDVRASVDGTVWTVTGTVEGLDTDTDAITHGSRAVTITANC